MIYFELIYHLSRTDIHLLYRVLQNNRSNLQYSGHNTLFGVGIFVFCFGHVGLLFSTSFKCQNYQKFTVKKQSWCEINTLLSISNWAFDETIESSTKTCRYTLCLIIYATYTFWFTRTNTFIYVYGQEFYFSIYLGRF